MQAGSAARFIAIGSERGIGDPIRGGGWLTFYQTLDLRLPHSRAFCKGGITDIGAKAVCWAVREAMGSRDKMTTSKGSIRSKTATGGAALAGEPA